MFIICRMDKIVQQLNDMAPRQMLLDTSHTPQVLQLLLFSLFRATGTHFSRGCFSVLSCEVCSTTFLCPLQQPAEIQIYIYKYKCAMLCHVPNQEACTTVTKHNNKSVPITQDHICSSGNNTTVQIVMQHACLVQNISSEETVQAGGTVPCICDDSFVNRHSRLNMQGNVEQSGCVSMSTADPNFSKERRCVLLLCSCCAHADTAGQGWNSLDHGAKSALSNKA